jgi:hypothetical protein
VPADKELVTIESGEGVVGAALTVMLSDLVAVSAWASVTFTRKVLVPVPVDVPEITPVVVASASPVGRVPEAMDQLYGVVPPVAASVSL